MRGLTSNFDLIHLAKALSIPLTAVIYKNDLLKFDPKKENNAFILDLHDDTDTSVGHWVALTKKNNKYTYFDSFGIIYPNIVKEFCKGYPLEYNNKQIQSMNSEYCGQYCLMFLLMMDRGLSLKDVQIEFNQFE